MDKKIRNLKIKEWGCMIGLGICTASIFGFGTAYLKTDNETYNSFMLVFYAILIIFYVFAMCLQFEERELTNELQDSENGSEMNSEEDSH